MTKDIVVAPLLKDIETLTKIFDDEFHFSPEGKTTDLSDLNDANGSPVGLSCIKSPTF